MNFQQVSEGIYTVEHFMSNMECSDWIAYSEKQGFEEAKVNVGGADQVINKHVRNNERLIYDSVKLADELWKRIQGYVPSETEYGIATGLNERFRFYKYFPGQQFRPHKDGSFMRNIHEWSSYTFMIYLNENMEGGETKFNDCIITPVTGKALIFKHELLHEGCPVISGVKYVLRTDVMYRRKKRNK